MPQSAGVRLFPQQDSTEKGIRLFPADDGSPGVPLDIEARRPEPPPEPEPKRPSLLSRFGAALKRGFNTPVPPRGGVGTLPGFAPRRSSAAQPEEPEPEAPALQPRQSAALNSELRGAVDRRPAIQGVATGTNERGVRTFDFSGPPQRIELQNLASRERFDPRGHGHLGVPGARDLRHPIGDLFANESTNPVLRTIGESMLVQAPGKALSLFGRVAGVGRGYANFGDLVNEGLEQRMQRQRELNEKTGAPWLYNTALSAVSSMTTMVAAGATAGPLAAIGVFMAEESNEAVTAGRELGLEGDELAGYVLRTGVIEATPALFMHAVGLGGMETLASQIGPKLLFSAGTNASRGMLNAATQVGIATAQEIPEELLTEWGHNINRAISNIEPDAMSNERMWETGRDTFLVTVMSMGMIGSPSVVGAGVGAHKQRQREDVLITQAANEAALRLLRPESAQAERIFLPPLDTTEALTDDAAAPTGKESLQVAPATEAQFDAADTATEADVLEGQLLESQMQIGDLAVQLGIDPAPFQGEDGTFDEDGFADFVLAERDRVLENPQTLPETALETKPEATPSPAPAPTTQALSPAPVQEPILEVGRVHRQRGIKIVPMTLTFPGRDNAQVSVVVSNPIKGATTFDVSFGYTRPTEDGAGEAVSEQIEGNLSLASAKRTARAFLDRVVDVEPGGKPVIAEEGVEVKKRKVPREKKAPVEILVNERLVDFRDTVKRAGGVRAAKGQSLDEDLGGIPLRSRARKGAGRTIDQFTQDAVSAGLVPEDATDEEVAALLRGPVKTRIQIPEEEPAPVAPAPADDLSGLSEDTQIIVERAFGGSLDAAIAAVGNQVQGAQKQVESGDPVAQQELDRALPLLNELETFRQQKDLGRPTRAPDEQGGLAFFEEEEDGLPGIPLGIDAKFPVPSGEAMAQGPSVAHQLTEVGKRVAPAPTEASTSLSMLTLPEIVNMGMIMTSGKIAVVPKMRGGTLGRASRVEGDPTSSRIRISAEVAAGRKMFAIKSRKPLTRQEAALAVKQAAKILGLDEEADVDEHINIRTRFNKNKRFYETSFFHNDPNWPAQIIAHEIGHVVDFVPTSTLKRGNILGRIATLKGHLKKSLGNLEEKPIRDELKALTEWWNPFDHDAVTEGYIKYRHSSRELYADFFSVFLNNPEAAQARAPIAFAAFQKFFDRKLFVKRLYEVIQESIQQGTSLDEQLDDYLAQFSKGRAVKQEAADEDYRQRWANYLTPAHWFGRIKSTLWDFRHELPTDEEGDTRHALSEVIFFPSVVVQMQRDLKIAVTFPLAEAGVSPEQFAAFLAGRRAGTERRGLFNPQGQQGEHIDELLLHLADRLGETKMQAIRDAAAAYWQWRNDHAIKRLREAEMLTEEHMALIEGNAFYTRFEVQAHFDAEHGSGSSARLLAPKQEGTLQDIFDPFISTFEQDVHFAHSAALNTARRTLVLDLFSSAPEKIREAPLIFRGGAMQPRNPPKNWKTVSYMDNGAERAFYVTEAVFDAFEDMNQRLGFWTQASNLLAVGPKMLYTIFSAGFLQRNPFRDTARSIMNVDENVFKAPPIVMRNSFRAIQHAWLDVYAEQSTPVVREMYLRAELIADRAFRTFEHKTVGEEVGALQDKFMKDPAAEPSFWRKAARHLNPIYLGQFEERLGKIAGKLYQIDNPGIDEDSFTSREEIRSDFSTPNPLIGGSSRRFFNSFFLFSNIKISDFRSSIRIAKRDPWRYGTKLLTYSILPKALLWSLSMGLFSKLFLGADDDDEPSRLEQLYAEVPEYYKLNYNVIVIGETPSGAPVYLTLPSDHIQAFSGAMTWEALRQEDGLNGKEFLRMLRSQNPFDIEQVNPIFGAVITAMDISTGSNPTDRYTGHPVIPQSIFDGGGTPLAKEYGKIVWNDFFSSVYRFKSDRKTAILEEADSIFAEAQFYPLAGPIMTGLIQVGNGGVEDLERRRIELIQKGIDRQYAAMASIIRRSAHAADGVDDMSGYRDAWQQVKDEGVRPEDYKLTDFKQRYKNALRGIYGTAEERRKIHQSGAERRAVEEFEKRFPAREPRL